MVLYLLYIFTAWWLFPVFHCWVVSSINQKQGWKQVYRYLSPGPWMAFGSVSIRYCDWNCWHLQGKNPVSSANWLMINWLVCSCWSVITSFSAIWPKILAFSNKWVSRSQARGRWWGILVLFLKWFVHYCFFPSLLIHADIPLLTILTGENVIRKKQSSRICQISLQKNMN